VYVRDQYAAFCHVLVDTCSEFVMQLPWNIQPVQMGETMVILARVADNPGSNIQYSLCYCG